MRKVVGWIRNLADGYGPPPGSVGVHATVIEDDEELDNETHGTGRLSLVHLNGGAASADVADAEGHFGWEMELSPGRINTQVVPTDPQQEYRWRFPDESSQYGKAFLSDLERLAWTGGRDGLVWNGILGGHDPTAAQWNWSPVTTWQLGNGSISAFGAGVNAMKVEMRNFIGFVGGTVFSIENGALMVPVEGVDPLPANTSGADRWDLICLRVVTDPAAVDYGKQMIELLQGGPDIPIHPGQPADGRRLAMHAVKVAAGAGVYSEGFDLRRWLWHPDQRTQAANRAPTTQIQHIGTGWTNSIVNEGIDYVIPLADLFNGRVTYTATIGNNAGWGARVRLVTESRGIGPNAIPNLTYAVNPPVGYIQYHGDALGPVTVSATWPLSVIPSYHVDSRASPASRTWYRMRFLAQLVCAPIVSINTIFVIDQHLAIQLEPQGN